MNATPTEDEVDGKGKIDTNTKISTTKKKLSGTDDKNVLQVIMDIEFGKQFSIVRNTAEKLVGCTFYAGLER